MAFEKFFYIAILTGIALNTLYNGSYAVVKYYKITVMIYSIFMTYDRQI
jgi:hypothetical protein